MVNIGVLGYGYWGPNLVRNFYSLDSCTVKTVAEPREDRLGELKKYYPSIRLATKAKDVINDGSIDAVVIATPVSTHYALAKEALNHGKHVLVEKPMASSFMQAQKLVALSKKQKKLLMVDHTFLYTDAVQKIKKIIESGEIGNVNYFDSTRFNLGLFQKDTNVLWDLATHDISILTYLIGEKPITIQANGISHLKNNIENIGFITIKYHSGLLAHIKCSWSSPVKIRLVLIGGTKKMIVYDDVEPTEKVKIYDTGYELKYAKDKAKILIDYRAGDIHIPKVHLKEGLYSLASDFIKAIEKGIKPLSDMSQALEVVKILALAQRSLKNGEKPVRYR